MGNSRSKAVRRCISEYVHVYSIRGLSRKRKSWGERADSCAPPPADEAVRSCPKPSRERSAHSADRCTALRRRGGDGARSEKKPGWMPGREWRNSLSGGPVDADQHSVEVIGGGDSGVPLVLLDLLFDFLAMGANIRPGVRQILGPKRGIAPQEFGLGDPLPPQLLQDPDGNPGANDARLAATHAWRALNTRKGVADVAGHPLQKLSLLATSMIEPRERGRSQRAPLPGPANGA